MTDAVTVHLMRHGAPTLAGRLLGATDCPVTPAGIAACRTAATPFAIDHVIASDLQRAAACAAAIAIDRGLSTAIDPRWRELDFGDWDGLATTAVDPDALGRFWADPDAAPPPNGERWSALVARIASALDALPAAALVVTHAGAMRAALAAACGFDHRMVWAFDLPYAAVLSLRLWPGGTAQIVGLSA